MKINEIFVSVSGEAGLFPQGSWVTFIRLQGCNLRCSFCDTRRALDADRSSGREMSADEIRLRVQKLGVRRVLITGGEPMLQKEELSLLVWKLREWGFWIQIETNGTFFPCLDHPSDGSWAARVDSWVMDYKLPSSGSFHLMRFENFTTLGSESYIKFVVENRKDYEVALSFYREMNGETSRVKFAFSPCFSSDDEEDSFPQTLYRWMKEDKLFNAIFSIQIHKLCHLIEE